MRPRRHVVILEKPSKNALLTNTFNAPFTLGSQKTLPNFVFVKQNNLSLKLFYFFPNLRASTPVLWEQTRLISSMLQSWRARSHPWHQPFERQTGSCKFWLFPFPFSLFCFWWQWYSSGEGSRGKNKRNNRYYILFTARSVKTSFKG